MAKKIARQMKHIVRTGCFGSKSEVRNTRSSSPELAASHIPVETKNATADFVCRAVWSLFCCCIFVFVKVLSLRAITFPFLSDLTHHTYFIYPNP